MQQSRTEVRTNKRTNFYKLFVFWLFVSVLPQFLRLSREDSQGTILKAVSVAFVVIWVLIDFARKNKKIYSREEFCSLICLVIIVMISNFVVNASLNANTDAYISVACTLFYYYAFMCQYSTAVITKKELMKIGSVIEIMVLYTCIMNLVIYGDQIIPLLSTLDADAYNISSVFFNRTNYASFLLIGIIFITIKLRQSKKGRFKHIVLLVIAIANLLLTLARTSIFTLIAFYCAIYIFEGQRRTVLRMFSLILYAALFILAVYATGVFDFIIKMIVRPQAGLTYRDIIWSNINQDLRNASILQILFGFGVSYWREAHNTLIGTMTKMGISGVLLYLWIYARSIKSIVYIWRKHTDDGVVFASIFLAFVVTSFTEEFTPFMSTSMSVIWTFTAILLPKYYANYQRSVIIDA